MKNQPKETKLKIASSQKQAAAITGIELAKIRFAKSLGSDAFRPGNKIHLAELQQFVDSEKFTTAWRERESSKDDEWDKRLKRAKALREEARLTKERSKLWDAEQSKLLIAAGDSAMAEVLRRRLEEQPALIAGKSAGEILKINRKFYDELIDELRESRVAAILEVGATLPDDEE